MIPGLYYALSAITAGNKKYGITSNNIANINSIAFKGKISHLTELSKGGVDLYSVTSSDGVGYFINTGRNLDLAINGEGFFKLSDSSGKDIFTRVGLFSVDKNGDIVDVSGRRLGINVGTNAYKLEVDNKGNIYVDNELKGKITLYSSNGNIIPESKYELLPGYLEASNVDTAKEMVDSITNLRYIQANVKTVKSVDEMLGKIVNIIG